jgi:hypothetical protein
MRRLLLLTLLLLLLGSCHAGRSVRKCDGRQGVRVPMGTL